MVNGAEIVSDGIPNGWGAAPVALPPPVADVGKVRKRINVQAKGKVGEREALKLIRDVMEKVENELTLSGMRTHKHSEDVKRNTMQSDRGGFDIHGVPLLALEIKRCETLALNDWWKQATKQANQGELPVVMFRRNKEAWRVKTYVALTNPQGVPLMWVPAIITLTEFLNYYETMYRGWLTNGTR